MDIKKPWRIILSAIAILLVFVICIFSVQFWMALQSTPTLQFSQARHRWEASSVTHYQLVASYYGNFSQCYYDVEVLQDRIVHVFSFSCISSAESKTFTVSGMFKNFERYASSQVCSSNGCSCEGFYVLRATYDPTLGYPQSITTEFNRDLLYDVLHGNWGTQKCLRTDPVVDKFERIKVKPLP
jgi:hypothetical protein